MDSINTPHFGGGMYASTALAHHPLYSIEAVKTKKPEDTMVYLLRACTLHSSFFLVVWLTQTYRRAAIFLLPILFHFSLRQGIDK